MQPLILSESSQSTVSIDEPARARWLDEDMAFLFRHHLPGGIARVRSVRVRQVRTDGPYHIRLSAPTFILGIVARSPGSEILFSSDITLVVDQNLTSSAPLHRKIYN